MGKNKTAVNRRHFLASMGAAAAGAAAIPTILRSESSRKIIKPPRLKKGDTVGLIAPASCVFEPATIREGIETLQSLGFKVQTGKHIAEKYGYLAGTDEQRVSDLHDMFRDDSVKAIFALRGGYGSMRLLDLIDYQLIRSHPKILMGYSDITSLCLGIYAKTGLVTFHGPVAISSFSEYTQRYFYQSVQSTAAIGEVELPEPDNPLRPTAHLATIRSGKATGRLVGGNLTLLTALLGTPYEPDFREAILFLEETGEEPYDIDRMLTQLLLSGKLDRVNGIIFDLCPDCAPRDYKPAFPTNLSVEEVLQDRLGHLKCPALFGLKVGHEADKPTMPLGVQVTLDADKKIFSFDEGAVI
ncbi:MAG: LD-carboxypeptidase [Calditrichaeota bacterium]|nr:LD-carboxypeptidase [Calditrichota bacterium]